jgi:hypothetical protein
LTNSEPLKHNRLHPAQLIKGGSGSRWSDKLVSQIIHVTISVVVAYPILSLIEYLIHRNIMHKPKMARALKSSFLWETFREHAVEHHNMCYDVFNNEKGSCGTVNIRIKLPTLALVISLPCLIAAQIDDITCLVLFIGALANSVIWSAIHSEMHQPRESWFCRTFMYRHLRRLHFLHHRHPGTNFNTLFLMWDWIFGTVATETNDDRWEMENGTWRVRHVAVGSRESATVEHA